ncbi:hypothetical protein LDENG_00133530, partial [Lucifuga dentata]
FKNVARLWPSLSFTSTKTLIHAFVTSRIDDCNSVLYSLTHKTINKLQYVQNSAVHLLTNTHRREHITPLLHDLHWFPVQHRITVKILLTTYKALNNMAPSYLSNLLQHHTTTRSLRSADANLLNTIRTK